MRHSLFETILGAIVLISAIAIAIYSYQINGDPTENYHIKANFNKIDGVFVGSDVKIGGIKIGKVSQTNVNTQNFLAQLTLTIKQTIKIPAESSAEIASEGILGKSFVNIIIPQQQNLNATLNNGDFIKHTKDAVSLEDLLGRALFLIGS